MSLSISKHIYSKLSGSEAVSGLVGDKIFPLSTKESTTFPFIIYKRSDITPSCTKDRYATGDNVSVEIIVASDDYFNSVKVAEAIRKSLENKKGEYSTFSVSSARFISGDEESIEDTFIQRLIFSFETE